MTTITYPEVKNAMSEAGLPVSAGTAWQGADQGVYENQYVPNVSYHAGVPVDHRNAMYGLAYPSVMPAAIAAAVVGAEYSSTLAASPLSGTHPVTVTLTLTETNKPAGATTSYAWTFGDGNTATTSVPTTTHSYAAAGSFTASCVPTINGTAEASSAIPAPIILT